MIVKYFMACQHDRSCCMKCAKDTFKYLDNKNNAVPGVLTNTGFTKTLGQQVQCRTRRTNEHRIH